MFIIRVHLRYTIGPKDYQHVAYLRQIKTFLTRTTSQQLLSVLLADSQSQGTDWLQLHTISNKYMYTVFHRCLENIFTVLLHRRIKNIV